MLQILHPVSNMLSKFSIEYEFDKLKMLVFIAKFLKYFLFQYNQSSQGSQCNQAIMLITDGTTETHIEVCISKG